jgi:signal transduction histidine kinase/CheY-like chemotaxis protein
MRLPHPGCHVVRQHRILIVYWGTQRKRKTRLNQINYTERFNAIWDQEHERKSTWSHRLFCAAFVIGYPIASLLYLLNHHPQFMAVFQLTAGASLLVSVVLFFHIRNQVTSQKLVLYTFLLLVFFQCIVLATIPHPTYERATFNLTLSLIYSALLIQWPVRYAILCSASILIGFPLALYMLDGAAVYQFLREGGLFYFLGQAIFPFIIRRRYESQKRTFYYQYTLSEQNVALEKQILIAKEATRAKTDFLSLMSHEIRTPLNGIVGIVHLLLKDDLKKNFQKEMIQTLLFSSNHLMTVVNDILDFNKINSNHVRLDLKAFDPKLLFQNLEKTFVPKAEEKKLQLIFDVTPSLPAQLIGDQGRLNQVITNLIHNAIKFTESGEVRFTVSESNRTEKTVLLDFKVSDTGLGIPLEQQSFIFELFNQADNTGTKKQSGSGLGLAITKEILKLYGSEITLSSEAGKGAAFSFSIQFDYLTAPIVREHVPAHIQMRSYPDAKILVVDDNPTNLLLATTFLKRKNLCFETARNGQEAVDMVGRNAYDLVLMDLRMPVMNGFEAVREIRAGGSNVPVVAVTASAFDDEKERAMANGFSGYLTKPFIPNDFYEIIYFHLDRKRKAAIEVPPVVS